MYFLNKKKKKSMNEGKGREKKKRDKQRREGYYVLCLYTKKKNTQKVW